MYYTFFVILLFATGFLFGSAIGEPIGRHNAMREAFENGVATQEIVGEKVVYRWIETHKIGYDAE